MTPQSSYKIIKEKLPEPYLSLIKKYIRGNRIAKDLPSALLVTPLWKPTATDEGYYFWESVYKWSIGERRSLPRVYRKGEPRPSASYNVKYQFCLSEMRSAIDVIEDLFGAVGADRRNARAGDFNVYKRYMIVSYMLSVRDDLFSLEMIGEALAECLGRAKKFNHATMINARKQDQILIETNEPTYCGMKQQFEAVINGNNDNNVSKIELTKPN